MINESQQLNEMDCQSALELLSAKLATEIVDLQHQQLAKHLASCQQCRSAELDWQSDDRQLNRQLGQKRRTTDGLLASVMDQVHQESVSDDKPAAVLVPASERPLPRRSGTLLTAALAAVVGFLLASTLFQSSSGPAPPNNLVQRPLPTAEAVPVARVPQLAKLIATTGPIRCRSSATGDWIDITTANSFLCAAETEICTGPATRCELQTSAGCVVRLNTNTWLVVESARRVRVKSGQIWCRSETADSFEVVADSDQSKSPSGRAVYECPFGSVCVLTLDEPSLTAQAESGRVTLFADDKTHVIAAGQSIQMNQDGRLQSSTTKDAVLASSWMDSLLMQKHPSDPELQQRVDALLAKVGKTDASDVYERELRSLGEHCILPLTRYVQSEKSVTNRSRRLKAMSVVADVSPTWNVKNLIGLLNDSDAEVRVLAASALQRLTGETSGSSEVWREEPAQQSGESNAWANWWDDNGDRFPPLGSETRL